MNLIHAIRRPVGMLPGLAPGVLASLTAVVPATVATARPGSPGWNKHPPPARLHPLAASGIPGWQQALMAVTVVLLAATLVWIAYPGPGRTAAGERAHRLSGDHRSRHTDSPGQPAAPATPALAHRNHRAGPRP
jgi:hypothetical protein